MIARLPIRLKVTLAFAAAMAVVLAATGLFLMLRFASELDATVDQGLRAHAEDVRTLVRQADNGLAEAGRGTLTQRGESFAEILTPTGHVLDATPALNGRRLLSAAEARRAVRTPVRVERRAAPPLAGQARLLAVPVSAQGQRLVVVVGASLHERDRALADLRRLLLLGGPAALLLASLAGYLVTGLALRVVEAMRARAERLSLTAPGGRLPVSPADDEIARLGTTLNAMLARNEAAFARERALISDASHELRTPLAVLKAEIEVALGDNNPRADLRTTLGSVAEEVDRLVALAEALLLIARADDGRLNLNPQPIELAAVCAGVAARFRETARRAGRAIVVDVPADLGALADRPRVEQALANLVENALRHGAGTVRIHAVSRDAAVELHVADEGAGFPPGFLPRAFERFSQPENARGADGSGLGLAIVKEIAHAHGGDAAARTDAERGADVWLTLPRAPVSHAPGRLRSGASSPTDPPA
ncbi:MAG TPA: HAMP domain-containing sensor histidine kinase [Conexibacter sp.]|jgi:two-component system OmpR family sensor kinase|nr:HAMP domain-containing sensor histidine kinase [Conexibacter sp.]